MSSEKFYKTLQPLPQFEVGAILKKDGDSYKAVNDIWNTEAAEGKTPSIGAAYVEHESNSTWFERVYSINLLTKTVYLVKDAALAAFNKDYTESK